MKTLLFILAIILMAAGFAVGLMNMFSPGTVTVGLNYDVAATLFTGGSLLLGLGVVVGSMASRGQSDEDFNEAPAVAPARHRAPEPDHARAVERNDDLPEFMAPAGGGATAAAGAAGAIATGAAGAVAAGASRGWDFTAVTAEKAAASATQTVTETASEAAGSATQAVTQTAGEAAEAVGEAVSDVAESVAETASDWTGAVPETAEDAVSATREAIAETAETATETVTQAASETAADATSAVEAAEEVADDAASAAGDAAHEVEEVVSETVDEAEATVEEAVGEAQLDQEDALFVVEERTIRDRPARLLSDGTVEAETDEGWMRFENVEHVEEYLDAMKATA